jgi:two-component system cell cycle sensor histidine kinase/response regulator CckA
LKRTNHHHPLEERLSATVLLVEDTSMLRQIAARVLRQRGYTVIEASNGVDALQAVSKENLPGLELLITDVTMPMMSGDELAEAILQKFPEIRILFISGHGDDVLRKRGLLEPGYETLPKPFTPTELLNKVRALLQE